MNKKRNITIAVVAVCVVCALLLVLSGLIDWQVDSTGTSGDIAKSSRFSRKTADTEVSNMQELLAGDEEYRNKIVLAYTVMQTRAEQFYMLVDMSIEAAGNIKEYDAVIADMKAAVPMVKNVCSSMDAAGEDLNAALGGETRKDLAQNTNNAALAYTTLQKQNELVDRFITITDEYVKKSSASAKLKFARDGWVDYQNVTAVLNEDSEASEKLQKAGSLLSGEEVAAVMNTMTVKQSIIVANGIALYNACGLANNAGLANMPINYLSLQSALNNAVNLADNAVLNNNEGLNSVAVIANNITELGNTIGFLGMRPLVANNITELGNTIGFLGMRPTTANSITELGNTIGSLANNANLANSSSVQAR